jgi:fumarate hydratase subunit beta
MQEVGCVYLSFLGGGATLHTRAVREVLAVGWADMLMHYRVVRLRVEGLGPVTVAIDAHGNSVYADAQAQARDRMPEILAAMDAQRARDQAG